MPLDNPADTRAALLDRAETRLMQSEACRIGYLRDSFVRDAVGLLRAAGCADLADRLDEDDWGSDTGDVLAEVERLKAHP